jgi:RNA polymerase sigma-70 factor (ECF subfamily)
MDYFRRGDFENGAPGGTVALDQLHAIADPISVQEPTTNHEASALLHRAMAQIRVEFTDDTWESFWRATVLGHPTDLIAAERGISPGAVRQAKSRVLRRLRKQLGDL